MLTSKPKTLRKRRTRAEIEAVEDEEDLRDMAEIRATMDPTQNKTLDDLRKVIQERREARNSQ